MQILYFMIALLATLFGSMTGAAGGVIIKPLLDMHGHYDATTIGLLSGITLIFMGLTNIVSHIIKKTEIKLSIAAPMTLGGVVGGILGGRFLNTIILNLNSDSIVKIIQNIILIILMISSLIYIKYKDKLIQFNIKNKVWIFFIGLLLGMFSTFLGIGGGPINVSAMILFLGLTNKSSAVYSIIIVIFSQTAKLATFALENNIFSIDFSVLPYMVIGGIIGGYFGARLNKRLPEKFIAKAFNIIQIIVILSCVINIVKNL